MTEACIIIPWRPHSSRQWGFRQVKSFYQTNFPEYPILIVDTNDPYFNLAGARNFGVNEVNARYGDIPCIITDADTIPEVKSIRSAVYLADEAPGVVLPYTDYRSLRRAGTKQFRDGTPLDECNAFVVDSACSGVYVTTPSTWLSHYGQDIRFRGWGYEDAAWEAAHNTLIGPIRRIPGNVYSFYHESQRKDGRQFLLNADLCNRYLQAQGDPIAMAALAKETHIGTVVVSGKVVEHLV